MAISNEEITKNSYQATAVEFAENVANLAPIQSIEKFISLLPPKAYIIDIGCGSGRDAKIFTERGIHVLGIDFCPNLINIAKSNVPSATFQIMNIGSLEFSESFDGVWAACSLSHIPKNKFLFVLQKIHALLKKDGIFYITLKKGQGEILEPDMRYKGDHKKFWSFYEEDELKNLLYKAQFKIIESAIVAKKYDYQDRDALRVFAKK